MDMEWVKDSSEEIFNEIFAAHHALTVTMLTIGNCDIDNDKASERFLLSFEMNESIREEMEEAAEEFILSNIGPMIDDLIMSSKQIEDLEDVKFIEFYFIVFEAYYQNILRLKDYSSFSFKNFFLISRYVHKIITLIMMVKKTEAIFMSDLMRHKNRKENIDEKNKKLLFSILKKHSDEIFGNNEQESKKITLNSAADKIVYIINTEKPNNTKTPQTIKNWLATHFGITAKNIHLLPEKVKNL